MKTSLSNKKAWERAVMDHANAELRVKQIRIAHHKELSTALSIVTYTRDEKARAQTVMMVD